MSVSAHQGEILHFLEDPTVGGDQQNHYFPNGLLVIDDGHVKACGAAVELLPGLPADAVMHHHDHGLIIPGLVDTHIHYPQVEVIAAYGTQLIDWLQNHTFPVESRFSDTGTASETARFFLDELLRNGTTTALVFGTVHPQSVDEFFKAALERNLRMICGKVMMDRNAPDNLLDTAETGYSESRSLIERWSGEGRLGYAVTPRFAPTSSDAQLAAAGKLVDEFQGVYLHTHLSENTTECEWVQTLFPQSLDYLDVYDRHGLLGRRSVFAHGIHLSDREWGRLGQTSSNISFCPTSNLFIGSGLFKLQKADEFQVRTGLGTDVGGGDSFSLLRTINEAYKVQQLQQFNLPPLRALYMATLGGARVLDLEKYIGNFEAGKEADFIVLDYNSTPLIQYRMASCKSLEEKLFALQMLGDDRAVRETWIMGEKLYSRETKTCPAPIKYPDPTMN
jgi:guanine deaminase